MLVVVGRKQGHYLVTGPFKLYVQFAVASLVILEGSNGATLPHTRSKHCYIHKHTALQNEYPETIIYKPGSCSFTCTQYDNYSFALLIVIYTCKLE